MSLQPFVKWAGGKRQIMDKLLEFKPKKFKHYYEPFVGGGALLLELAPIHATINDSNKELMYVYKCLRNKRLFKKFYELCKQHEENHSEDYYYQIRDLDRKKTAYSKMTMPEKAARCIYLNKACFNGLYRVNSKNEFNVPSGKKNKVNTYDGPNLGIIHCLLNFFDIQGEQWYGLVINHQYVFLHARHLLMGQSEYHYHHEMQHI